MPLYFDNLKFIIKYFYFKSAGFDEIYHPGKDLVGMTLVIADIANADGSHLPGIIIINLSHGNIELITNTAGNRLEDLPFALEGHVLGDAERNLTYAYVHAATILRIKRYVF